MYFIYWRIIPIWKFNSLISQNPLGLFPTRLTIHQTIRIGKLKNYTQHTDEALIAYLKEGDVRAFEEIYNRHWDKLYSVAYHQLGSKEEAEQLVQEVFEKLWKRRTELTINHLGVYLVVSIKNLAVNFIKAQITFRKYQEYLIFQEIQQNYQGQDIVNYNDLAQAVENVMKQLPEKTAEIFRLSRFENQSNKDIAAQLHLTEKAVEYHITKSLKFFKTHLKHYHSDN
jgi:RNA polymerase sigma-70 factor (family 1)